MNYLFSQMWRTAFAVVLMLGIVNTSKATTLTLTNAIKKTLAQNPQLHQFEYIRAHLQANRDSAALNPALELSAEIENFSGTGQTQGFQSTELTVALSSVLEFGNKRQSRLNVYDLRLEQIKYESQAQTLDVLGSLTQVFIQLLTTQEELSLAQDSVALADTLYRTVKTRGKQGAASDAEVIRAKAQSAQAQLHLDGLQRKFERQKVSLARYWGATQVSFSTVQGDLYTFGDSKRFSDLYKKVKSSPAIAVYASDIRLKNAEIKLAQTQNTANLSWQFGIKRLQETSDTALMVGFSMPLFSENRNRGQVRASIVERDAATYRQSERLLALHDRLYNAYSQHQQFIESYHRLNNQIIPDLEQALVITRDGYERGRLKYQDWIAAQRELLNAKQQLIESASSALSNQAVIEQLTAESLTN